MSSGSLDPFHDIRSSRGIRPVINLKTDTKITKGDWTALNPYVVKS